MEEKVEYRGFFWKKNDFKDVQIPLLTISKFLGFSKVEQIERVCFNDGSHPFILHYCIRIGCYPIFARY